MAIIKTQADGLNLADDFAFTGTITGAGGFNTPNFFVIFSSNFSLANTTNTLAPFDQVVFDTASAYNNTASNYKYTIPSGEDGKYLINFAARKENFTGASLFYMLLYLNGSEVGNSTNGSGGQYDSLQNSVLLDLSAGDYLQCYLYQNSGSTQSIRSVTNNSFFGGYKIIE